MGWFRAPDPSFAPPSPSGHIGRTYAVLDAVPPLADPSDPPVRAARCEAPGCGQALTLVQVAKEARACSPRCRAASHRARRRAAVLARLDSVAAEVARLRSEVERW